MNPLLQSHLFGPRFSLPRFPLSPSTSSCPHGELHPRLQLQVHDNHHSPHPTAHYTYTYTSHATRQRRHFTTSNQHQQKQLPDHYSTLSVPPTATSSEIKESFYSLSKTHHPDRTRSTLPPAEAESSNNKYLAISEAYAVLGDKTKREKYDRERAEVYGAPNSGGAAAGARGWGAGGSGFGSGQPGGRKASGLSRRRSQFRGPPPSFYRSGAWGGAASKRQREHDTSTGTGTDSRPSSNKGTGNANDGSAPNNSNSEDRDPSGNPWPFRTDPNDVPHFDRRAHFRRQNTLSEQLTAGRKKRRKLWEDAMRAAGRPVPVREDDEVERERRRVEAMAPSDNKAFFVVSAVLAAGLFGGLGMSAAFQNYG
ncbi:MAG: hypothetical protein M1831_003243 [Alyxoria varia]|nr:MAG: hypothetical protein M1831_003243 [Alyxoria varia]